MFPRDTGRGAGARPAPLRPLLSSRSISSRWLLRDVTRRLSAGVGRAASAVPLFPAPGEAEGSAPGDAPAAAGSLTPCGACGTPARFGANSGSRTTRRGAGALRGRSPDGARSSSQRSARTSCAPQRCAEPPPAAPSGAARSGAEPRPGGESAHSHPRNRLHTRAQANRPLPQPREPPQRCGAVRRVANAPDPARSSWGCGRRQPPPAAAC